MEFHGVSIKNLQRVPKRLHGDVMRFDGGSIESPWSSVDVPWKRYGDSIHGTLWSFQEVLLSIH